MCWCDATIEAELFVHGRLLLATVGALGLVHGISFSASYQLVSRFANKNTIALGAWAAAGYFTH